jgi:hypothetical protein
LRTGAVINPNSLAVGGIDQNTAVDNGLNQLANAAVMPSIAVGGIGIMEKPGCLTHPINTCDSVSPNFLVIAICFAFTMQVKVSPLNSIRVYQGGFGQVKSRNGLVMFQPNPPLFSCAVT